MICPECLEAIKPGSKVTQIESVFILRTLGNSHKRESIPKSVLEIPIHESCEAHWLYRQYEPKVIREQIARAKEEARRTVRSS